MLSTKAYGLPMHIIISTGRKFSGIMFELELYLGICKLTLETFEFLKSFREGKSCTIFLEPWIALLKYSRQCHKQQHQYVPWIEQINCWSQKNSEKWPAEPSGGAIFFFKNFQPDSENADWVRSAATRWVSAMQTWFITGCESNCYEARLQSWQCLTRSCNGWRCDWAVWWPASGCLCCGIWVSTCWEGFERSQMHVCAVSLKGSAWQSKHLGPMLRQ